MRLTLDQKTVFRDAERARIARWFGESLFEPVFHDTRYGPLPVRPHMRDTWLAEANRIVDRQAAQLDRVGFEAIAIGFVLTLAFMLAQTLVGDQVPMLRRIPAPAAGAAALLWPLVQELRYRARLRAWRREIGDRLCVRDRVDAKLVGTGRKYNLFSGLSGLLALLVFGWGLVGVIERDAEWNIVPMLVVLPAIGALHAAGRRVDRNQRRKPSDRSIT